MVRGTMTTRRIGSPSAGLSGAAVESGCWAAAVVSGRWAAAVESGPAAGAARSTLAAKPLARTLAPPRRAQSLTRQLGFTGEREALDEILEGLLGLGGLAQLLLAQRQLVERRRNLVPLGEGGLHLRVLHGRAVELGLREQTLSDAVLGVVRELERGEVRDEVPELLQRERVPPLRQVLGRLIVKLIRIRGAELRLVALVDLLEASHDLVQLAPQALHLLEHLLGRGAGGGPSHEQDVALLGHLAAHVLDLPVGHGVAHRHRVDHRAQAVEPAPQGKELGRNAARQRPSASQERRQGQQRAGPRRGYRVPEDRGRPPPGYPRQRVRDVPHFRTTWARRFFCQALSSWPGSKGRSLPYETTSNRDALMPAAAR